MNRTARTPDSLPVSDIPERSSGYLELRLPKLSSLHQGAPTIPFTYVLVAVVAVLAYLLGVYTTKVQDLERGQSNQVLAAAATPTPAPNLSAPAALPTLPAKVNVDNGHLPILGNANAKVKIVEFADLRCPFCEQFYKDSEPQIIKDYVDTGKASFAFRQYAFLGPESTVAAEAAECANDQGKFWDFHNYMYDNQASETDTAYYSKDNLITYAGDIGLDTTQFADCLNSDKHAQAVADELNYGKSIGVTATPTIFINGVPIQGAVPYEQFKAAIEEALKS